MNQFYFFKRGGICETMTGFLKNRMYEKYLQDPIDYQGRNVKFYLILDWVHRNNHGANLDFIKQYKMNYVVSVKDLPPGGGAYSVGYDVNLKDLEYIQENNIPFIENSCPRIKLLREQLLSANPDTHQLVFMIYDYHLIYSCYESAYPEDIIIVNPENYREQLVSERNEKPVHLLVYGVFRPREVEALIEFIDENYPHPDNILDSYNTTRCCWTKQGLLEEIARVIKDKVLDEVWVICSNEKDTSTRGIVKEIIDCGARPLAIESKEDIPDSIDPGKRYGVLVAPIPLSDEMNGCIRIIESRFEPGNNP